LPATWEEHRLGLPRSGARALAAMFVLGVALRRYAVTNLG
jgi:hypothetical protein